MRSKLFLFIILLAPAIFTACNDNLDSENVSKITNYPTFKMEGDEVVTVVKGTSFTDPGVTTVEGYEVTSSVTYSPLVTAGHPEIFDYETMATVDANTTGMYIITYTSINPDGFPGTTNRYVFVLDSAPDPSVDLTGHYTSGSSPEADITKLADGIFYSTNVWGGGSTVRIQGYLVCVDGVNVNIPQQESLVTIYGFGTRTPDGILNLKMSRPTFGPPPLIDLAKKWTKQQ